MCVRILFVLGMLAICEATPVLASEFAAEGQDARHSSNHCGNQILRNNRFAAAAFAPPNASDSAVPENGAVLCQPGQPQLSSGAIAPGSQEAKCENETEDTYIGNIESMKYHLPSCEFAEIMAKRRRLEFKGKQKAKQLGMSPCNWCMPSWSLHVEARLLEARDDQNARDKSLPPVGPRATTCGATNY